MYTNAPNPMPAPLPPIPPLADPTAVFVAGTETADELVDAAVRKAWTSPRTVVSLAALVVGIFLLSAVYAGIGGIVGALITVVVLAIVLTRSSKRSRAIARDSMARYTFPGAVLATRFGPDAVDIQTPTFHTRYFYDQVTVTAVNDKAVVIRWRSGQLLAFPRQLFPDFAVAYMRTATLPPSR